MSVRAKANNRLPRQRSPRRLLTIVTFVLLLSGAFATWMEARSGERYMREIMLGEARMVIGAIDLNKLSGLSGSESDLALPDYHYLRNQLIRMRAANSRYRYLYLFGFRPGEKPFFLMGTAPENSPDYVPPGMVYFEESPTLNHVFTTRQASVSPPFKDRWGTWISALVPVIEPTSGKLLAIFGMDFDAEEWNAETYRRSLMPIVMTFLAIIFTISLAEYAHRRQLASENKILAESAKRLANFFDVVPDFLLLLDRQGTALKINHSLAETLGFAAAELEGNGIIDFIHPDDLDVMVVAIASSLPDGPIREYIMRIKTKDGGYRTVEWRVRSHGRQIYVAGHDITERLQVETQLRQMQKMEVLGKLAGGVAHDFNNLLQAIIGNAMLLKEQLPADSQGLSELGEIQRASEMAANLTRQLLTFSRKKELEPIRFELNMAIHESSKMIRRLIGENIQLQFQPREDVGAIYGDRGQIEQILLNLCVNAKDAMPDGGVLTIETEKVLLDESYCEINSWARLGAFAVLTVTDTGCGMAPETQAQIFEPFFTTKSTDKGTGLGLATVYAIVKQHEGLISVYSELGKGTIFRIFLPSDDTAPTYEAEKNKEVRFGHGELLLLAEDNDAVRHMLKVFLEKHGYRVLAAVDGREALELFRLNRETIQCLILDIVMPRLGGLAVYRALHKENPEIRCLFVSGYSDNLPDLDIPATDRLAIMQKPYHPNALLEKLDFLLQT